MRSAAIPRLRSALFVPGHRSDFLSKVDRSAADGVIVDLEDGVSAEGKNEARVVAGSWLRSRSRIDAPAVCVRVNPLRASVLEVDLESIVHDALLAVVLPKTSGPDDVRELAEMLAHFEGKRGLPQGHVRIWPLVESAEAVLVAHEIARASSRIAFMGGGAAERGDLASSVGFRWTAEGAETLYIQSKLLVAVRAARVHNPMTGMVSRIPDRDVVRAFALRGRQIGYEGMMVIHPSHVPIVNEVFSPTLSEIEEAKGILAALDAAHARGDGATAFDGQMLDVAMAASAEAVLHAAGASGVSAVDSTERNESS